MFGRLPELCCVAGSFVGATLPKKISGKPRGWAVEKFTQALGRLCRRKAATLKHSRVTRLRKQHFARRKHWSTLLHVLGFRNRKEKLND